MNAVTKIALVDDHVLIRNGLANYIQTFGNYTVSFQADNGKDLIERLKPDNLPDIVLLDIKMPEMDGYETCLWLRDNYPDIKVLALSMYDNESSIIRMLRSGAKGYILKDCDPGILKDALSAVVNRGFYYSELVTGTLIHTINRDKSNTKNPNELNDREIAFLKLVCTELTYKEIADKMFISPRTIDNYRDDLFKKLELKTRVGLVMYAIKNGIVVL